MKANEEQADRILNSSSTMMRFISAHGYFSPFKYSITYTPSW